MPDLTTAERDRIDAIARRDFWATFDAARTARLAAKAEAAQPNNDDSTTGN